MIVRLLGEGQFEIADHTVDSLNGIDTELQAAVDADDEAGFHKALADMHALVHQAGTRVPDDYLGPSDFVLPDPDSTLEEVRALLSDEGLIPG